VVNVSKLISEKNARTGMHLENKPSFNFQSLSIDLLWRFIFKFVGTLSRELHSKRLLEAFLVFLK